MVCAGSSAVVALLHAHVGCALHVGHMRSQLSCLVSNPEVVISYHGYNSRHCAAKCYYVRGMWYQAKIC